MGEGPQLHGLDEVVREVHIHARLPEGVERRACGPAANEPGLKALHRGVDEGAFLPDIVAMAADKVRPRIPVGLGMDEQHRFADCARQCIVAGERADLAVHHDMGGRERAHQVERVGHRVGVRLVLHVVAVGILRHVEVLFADIIDLVVADRIAVAVLQPVPRQHHDRAVHAGHDMVGDHDSARCAVVDEGARLGRLPAQHDLLARLDERKAAAAESARGRMEVDIVLHDVGFGVLQRELDIVTLVADHQRTRNRAVERQRVDDGSVIVDLALLLVDGQLHFDDFRAAGRNLLVLRRERRGDKLLLDPRQAVDVGLDGCIARRGLHDGAQGRHGAQGAAGPKELASVQLKHGSRLLCAVASRSGSIRPNTDRWCNRRIRRPAVGHRKMYPE